MGRGKVGRRLVETGYDVGVIDSEEGIVLALPGHQEKPPSRDCMGETFFIKGCISFMLYLATKVIFSSCCYFIYLDSTFLTLYNN